MNEAEWQTRKDRIDQRLRSLNPRWEIIPYRAGLDVSKLTCHAVTEIPTANGPADYGLFVNGLFLGITEAKKATVNPQNVLEQAKRYSQGAFNGPGNWSGYRVPFLFASNGELIWFLDMRHDKALSRQIANFHTGPALEALFAFTTPKGNKFAQEYEVYSQRFQREDFGDDDPFDPKVLPNEYLTAPKPSHTFVYVSTIQRMARNLFGAEGCFAQSGGDTEVEADADQLDIPIHAFDVIIADECHRGYTAQEMSIWRETINHFDAIKIGLTATPAAHTTAVFGSPVFRYTVEQAILDGYLVDYEPVAIKSEVRMNGVFLKEGETVERVDTDTGQKALDQLEDERQFNAEAVEHDITAPDSNRKIIEEVAKYAYDHEAQTGRFPKILIFAVNDLPHTSHADQLVRLCRELFKQGDAFVQKITGNPNVDRPLQRIREFRNRPNPKVVVTVDMLSTGVDIPALEFIVFLRPVTSRILWEQMLGRGTRLCPDINKAQAQVDKLTASLLAKAFRGQLVPQDPTDEPAEKLLERIREERPQRARIARMGKGKANP